MSNNATTAAGATPVAVVPGNLISIALVPAVLGLTARAVEGKIYRRQWLEGREFHRDPTGGIWIDRKGVERWVTSKA